MTGENLDDCNKTVSVIRNSKMSFYDSISAQLSSPTPLAKDSWTALRSFINQNTATSVPPLEPYGLIYTPRKLTQQTF